jgi:hypothetical protein
MSLSWVWRDGARLTPWMLYVINWLNADALRVWGTAVYVSSGLRTEAEQTAIFLARYVRAGDVRGRRVYDTRWWNGVLWYRISSAGTVAVPRTSNHEVQGTRGAADLRGSGRGGSLTDRNSAFGRWVRQWCREQGVMIASGDGFGEGWHFDIPNIDKTPPGAPAGGGGGALPIPEGVADMAEQFIATKNTKNEPITDQTRQGAWVNTESGFAAGTSWFSEADAAAWAAQCEIKTVKWLGLGQFNNYLAGLAQVRAGK